MQSRSLGSITITGPPACLTLSPPHEKALLQEPSSYKGFATSHPSNTNAVQISGIKVYGGPDRLVFYREASTGLSKLAYFWALDTWSYVGKLPQLPSPCHRFDRSSRSPHGISNALVYWHACQYAHMPLLKWSGCSL